MRAILPPTLALLLYVAVSVCVSAEADPPCTSQPAGLASERTQAQVHDRSREAAGQPAPSTTQCRPPDAASAKRRDARIRKAERKVESLQRTMASAARDGNIRRMQDARDKLEHANRELAEAQRPTGQ
ncbi:MAG: DUF1090 family protein [Steroidobacteraceae bacterium]